MLLVSAGICLYYTALQLLPLADVVVFGFLVPLIVALLSPLLVKEQPSWCVLIAAAHHPFGCLCSCLVCLRFGHSSTCTRPCRMVLAMTPVCIIGVVLCLKPSFIFGGKQRLNTAGVIAALLQAFVGSLVKVRFV